MIKVENNKMRIVYASSDLSFYSNRPQLLQVIQFGVYAIEGMSFSHGSSGLPME